MHHPMRVATRTDMLATKIRVETFEIVKQKSNSAMENITILSMESGFQSEPSATSGEARDDVRPHEQPQGKAEINSHRFKTEDSVRTPVEICRLPMCYLGNRHQVQLSTYCACRVFFMLGTVETN
jgi:hypothetical protein